MIPYWLHKSTISQALNNNKLMVVSCFHGATGLMETVQRTTQRLLWISLSPGAAL